MSAFIFAFVKVAVVLGLWLFAGLILALIIAPALRWADTAPTPSRLISFAGLDE